MRALAQRQNQPQQAASGSRRSTDPLRLAQHTFGNQAVQRLLRTSPPASVVARQVSRAEFAFSEPVEEEPGAAETTEEETQPAVVQRSPASGQPAPARDLAQSIDSASRGGGRPLPPATRQLMETRFGRDFGNVSIHTDRTAASLAQQLQARAFTTGDRIFFAPGEFQPGQTNGKRLLAHELAHVVQQSQDDHGMDRQIQRTGNGCLNCKPYCSYDKSAGLTTYNCAGLAHRSYDYKTLAQTRAALAKGTAVACGTPCDHVGVVKHWLWEFDTQVEDSSGKVVVKQWHDFHTVAGPTDGDPVAKDSDEFYSKNGKRPVYGPNTAPTFKPAAKARAIKNEPAETPGVDDQGKPLYQVNSNITETCACFECP